MSPANSSFQRTDRVADLMQREIADILLKEVKDPRVQFVTITAVRVTKDLRNARVFYTSMQEGEALDSVAEGLQKAAGFVQRKIGGRLKLRNTPHIIFVYDSSFETGAHMDRLLREIEQSLPPDTSDEE